ncbi:DUF1990 family protein [Streptomyces bathyalis]|uniref:DUF1990 family protein n=1 Tax=Streptomyces bathyalis TaxID=2710756 RepID=A0A7T1T887_9ACTN|nr:DUF1990 family protein [Streptomyces bathyalis]QPP08222.1 DUF1990 family protein [Streptomyces bathyalis]
MTAPDRASPRRVTPGRRAGVLLRLPVGILLVSWQYFWRITALHRTETRGDAGDLPPPLPQEAVDEQTKPLSDGVGPMFHRRFRVRIVDARTSASELAATVAANLNRAAPWTVAVFVKTRGREGELRVGDEYRVQMPGPWDGPVRVIGRDATSFTLGTLQGHLEAGQIRFGVRAVDGALEFETEAWSRAGDRLADLLYSRLRVAKEIQFNMWVHFCLNAAAFSGGRPSGGVVIETRGVPGELCRDAGGR